MVKSENKGDTAVYDSPLGRILIKSRNGHITGLGFCKEDIVVSEHTEPVIDEAMKWLDTYFSGKNPGPVPPLELTGTPFRMKVWDILRTIPYGTTTTYGEIAKTIAEERGLQRMSAQAVGNAVGSNPIAIIIPCHRVIGSDGSLVGYAFGTNIKSKLLSLEGIETHYRGLHPSGPQVIP